MLDYLTDIGENIGGVISGIDHTRLINFLFIGALIMFLFSGYRHRGLHILAVLFLIVAFFGNTITLNSAMGTVKDISEKVEQGIEAGMENLDKAVKSASDEVNDLLEKGKSASENN